MKISRLHRIVIALALPAALLPLAHADDVPLWQKAVKWISGDSRETTVPTMMMGTHMQMSTQAAPRPGDVAQAERIVADARAVLQRYANVADAERDGYLAFSPTGRIGEEVHYTSVKFSGMEGDRPDWTQPGSLLYRRTPQGMKAIGVMMTATNAAGPADLDARAPRSVAIWHRHVDFCGEPKNTPKAELEGPRARFGFYGSIHTQAACQAAGGFWIPVAFGWMTHVYPDEAAGKIWGGEHMAAGAHVH